MYDYKAPIQDLEFTYFDLFGYEQHLQQIPEYQHLDKDTLQAVISESAKFCEQVIAPLNREGDEQGCQWQEGKVTTPDGFKEAYVQYKDAGWTALASEEKYGGQNLPPSLGSIHGEMLGGANWSWSTYPGLSTGAKNTLVAAGSDEQKEIYLTKLVSGDWTGTMCLTEAHCGTDLGLMKTKAVPHADGNYRISGTKIFISAGEHDLAENIVHIVLAKLPDAPDSTKGLSLFIVPKFLPDANGNVGERNAVHCGSIEKKMGIKGSATCVMNFDGAVGYMIGAPNRGLQAMFVFMNTARLGTALQGVSHADFGLQKARAYANDRLQMRALTGPKNPDGPADPIIVHPDVRRMLLTQKAYAEGGRMLVAYCALLADLSHVAATKEEQEEAESRLSFLTPIAKAFLTEKGCESANLAIQCFGGHGFIREWGVEQNFRDCRIATLYEGTTGIQALDLLGRKVMATQGEAMQPFIAEVKKFCQENKDVAQVATLNEKIDEWLELTQSIGAQAMEDFDVIGSASVDYLMYSGYVVFAYLWAKAAVKASSMMASNPENPDFLEAKIKTADFYFKKILPLTASLVETIKVGAEPLMSIKAEQI